MSVSKKNYRDRIECKCLKQLGAVEVVTASYQKQNFSRHAHDCYGFGVITNGRLDFLYQHKNWRATPGDINLVIPGEVHDGHGATDYGWSYKMLYIPVDFVEEVIFEIANTDSLPYFLQGVISNNDLSNKFLEIHNILYNDDEFILQKDSMLRHWLVSFISAYSKQKIALEYNACERRAVLMVREYLYENFADNIKLSDLANIVGLSPYYLLRIFKKVTGLPPHLYQQQIRVDKAKKLLSIGESLARISHEIGFVDQSHFSRQFKKTTGLTPAQYQKMF